MDCAAGRCRAAQGRICAASTMDESSRPASRESRRFGARRRTRAPEPSTEKLSECPRVASARVLSSGRRVRQELRGRVKAMEKRKPTESAAARARFLTARRVDAVGWMCGWKSENGGATAGAVAARAALGTAEGVGSCNQRCEQPRREGRFRLPQWRGWPRRTRETCAPRPRFPTSARFRDQVPGAPA